MENILINKHKEVKLIDFGFSVTSKHDDKLNVFIFLEKNKKGLLWNPKLHGSRNCSKKITSWQTG